MKKLIINPHFCSREEYEELKNYLNDNSWDVKEFEEKPISTDRFKLVTAKEPHQLSSKVNELIGEGYEPVGSHSVVILKTTNRFSGTQHKDSFNDVEYSQTMIKK